MDVLTNNTSARTELHDPLVLVLVRLMLACTGIIANSIVMFVFIYNKTYKKSLSRKLLLHQTVIDLTGSVMFLIFYNTDVPDGTGGTIFCKMQFLFVYTSATSTFNFVMLTIERYTAVVHPLLYRQKSLDGKFRYLSLISPHVIGLILTGSIPIHADIHPTVKECKPTEINAGTGVLSIVVNWMIPVCIMLYCYVRMMLKLRKKRTVSQQPSSESQPRNFGRVQTFKSDLLSTLILIASVYIVTVTPFSVFYFIYFISDNYNYIFHELSVMFLELNLTINPFIYCLVYKDFQRGLYKIRQDIFLSLETPNT
ncbi:kappa-type opioid receptor-like [Anneissia japonica]|uniref:kappa-type opioid receptor-like n=1 Tax=Anneissia japonica TaxID=1529436 RepID=UPI001425AE3C|nr:kappa-type opioid receptor-like [Anneissia japonica]